MRAEKRWDRDDLGVIAISDDLNVLYIDVGGFSVLLDPNRASNEDNRVVLVNNIGGLARDSNFCQNRRAVGARQQTVVVGEKKSNIVCRPVISRGLELVGQLGGTAS